MGVRRTILLLTATLAAACYDRTEEPLPSAVPPTATTTLSVLHNTVGEGSIAVTSAIVVEGRVTSTDEADNFHRTLVIEQGDGALELMAGQYQLADRYPVGTHVSLRLDGLTLARSRGVVQAGYAAVAGSGYATEYIPSQAALDRHLIRHDKPLDPIMPRRLRIADLREEMCGLLVRIDSLTYAPPMDSIYVEGWFGRRAFADPGGDTVETYVRDYARFAKSQPPRNMSGSITGILQLSGNRFSIKPRHEGDLGF